jgi:acetylornithine/succinyldiaminopimelate/putrescine aminotransferase
MNNEDCAQSRIISTVDQFPIRIVEGNGLMVIDSNGKFYHDLWNDEGVNSLGYHMLEEFIHDILIEKSMVHIPKMYHSVNAERLAFELSISMYGNFDWMVMFHNSGTEANEAAIKLARKFWYDIGTTNDKTKIVSFHKNFHGRTYGSLSAGDMIGSPHHYGGFGKMLSDFIMIEPTIKSLNDFYFNMSKTNDIKKIAAFIIAPILGNNTVELYEDGFLKRLKEISDEIDSLLIYDEIQVGCGRTGSFWAYQALPDNIIPDILTFGKGIAAGLPLSGIIAKGSIARSFSNTKGCHYSTTGGNELACSAALTVVDYINNNMDKIKIDNAYIINRFKTIKNIKNVIGLGIHFALHYDWNFLGINSIDFCKLCLKNGLLVVSHRENSPIRFFPTLNATKKELCDAITKLEIVSNSL